MPRMVTRPVMASMATAIRLSWRMVVNVTSGWRHSKNGRIAGIGFCLPWLSLLRRPNTTTKADFFPHHFGEGIGIVTMNIFQIGNTGVIVHEVDSRVGAGCPAQ